MARGRGRPAAAGGQVSRAQPAAVRFLGDLRVPRAPPFSFVFSSAGARTGGHGGALSGAFRGGAVAGRRPENRVSWATAGKPRLLGAARPGAGSPGSPGSLLSLSFGAAPARTSVAARARCWGFAGAAFVWRRPETLGSPGRGPRLGLPDAARSRGFQVPREGSSSPFLCGRLRGRAVEGARRGAGVGAIAGRRGRAPANSGGTGGPHGRGFRRKLGVSAKNKKILDVRFSCFLGVIISKFAIENGYDHFFYQN